MHVLHYLLYRNYYCFYKVQKHHALIHWKILYSKLNFQKKTLKVQCLQKILELNMRLWFSWYLGG